jgi:hypothetical protein
MKTKPSGYLAPAIFWIGLLAMFGWEASAQIPRPPLPIPNVTPARPPATTVALMPATIPLTRSSPTPIPPATTTTVPLPPQRPTPTPVTMPVPARIPLPPPEYDRPYTGKLTILKQDDYLLIKHVCNDTPNPIACSFRTYDTVSGETLSCLILLGPKVHDDERALRHEMGHCNSWPGTHPGARYGD